MKIADFAEDTEQVMEPNSTKKNQTEQVIEQNSKLFTAKVNYCIRQEKC